MRTGADTRIRSDTPDKGGLTDTAIWDNRVDVCCGVADSYAGYAPQVVLYVVDVTVALLSGRIVEISRWANRGSRAVCVDHIHAAEHIRNFILECD